PVVRANLASFSMYIYDRWGQIIYKTDSYTPWDGTCNGRYASAGVYFCVISYSCANEPEKIVNKQGSVTLLR
ncbi:MAG: gliding motility-associated C-terminal domain-containing protein, partial [Lentimicrobiaceae bacterium]|nr:gliding motility-associated C-terminal domain-containing protein [Lentimicrobiaceae bacterium]